MGEWIYKSLGFNPQMEVMERMKQHGKRKKSTGQITTNYYQASEGSTRNIIEASSPKCAVQKNWKTPTDFPLCPTELTDTAMMDYYNNLLKGKTLTSNVYGSTVILDFAINEEKTQIWVLCKRTEENPVKSWTLAGIYLQNGKIIHENLHSFFTEKEGLKQFTLVQGEDWTGGDSFDDYC